MGLMKMAALKKLSLILILPVLIAGSVGCSSLFSRDTQTVIVETENAKYPEGTVEYVW